MYQKGEVVWAKVKGFPWWPGVVKYLLFKYSYIRTSRSQRYQILTKRTLKLNFLLNLLGTNHSMTPAVADLTHFFQARFSTLAKSQNLRINTKLFQKISRKGN